MSCCGNKDKPPEATPSVPLVRVCKVVGCGVTLVKRAVPVVGLVTARPKIRWCCPTCGYILGG